MFSTALCDIVLLSISKVLFCAACITLCSTASDHRTTKLLSIRQHMTDIPLKSLSAIVFAKYPALTLVLPIRKTAPVQCKMVCVIEYYCAKLSIWDCLSVYLTMQLRCILFFLLTIQGFQLLLSNMQFRPNKARLQLFLERVISSSREFYQ